MPDEKKCSVSSADESLVMDGCFETKLPTALKMLRMSRIVSGVVVTQALVAALVVTGICVCAYLFATARASHGSQPIYINLVINTSSVPRCPTPLTEASPLPCLKDRKLVTGDREVSAAYDKKTFPIGPMRCLDDAFVEPKVGPNNCVRNPFVLADDGTDVIIPETGVYMVHSTVTFYDSLDFYVTSIIRITPASCLANSTCVRSVERRDSASHTWLSCFNHHRLSSSPGAAKNTFSTCSTDGLRRFDKGDAVSLQTTQAFRTINPSHKLTRLSLHRL